MSEVRIHQSWKSVLSEEFDKDYFKELVSFLKQEKKQGKEIYPPGNLLFNAFEMTPWDEVKVVIIGQDPYHGPGQAMGLSFSVPAGVRIPPSLKNIYKELQTDIGMDIPAHGDLTGWADQGVLLLNAMLTVEHKKAGSHQKKGWEEFTDAVISKLDKEKEGIVFLLWGRYAQAKGEKIDRNRHLVLEAAHPSPLAGGKFFGNNHFSKTNSYLRSQEKSPIKWESLHT